MPVPWVSLDEVASHLVTAKGPVFSWIEPQGLSVHLAGMLWKFGRSEVDGCAHTGGAGVADGDREGREDDPSATSGQDSPRG